VGGAATVGDGTELTGVDVPNTALAGAIVGTGEGGGVDNEGVGGEGGRVELFGVSGVVEAAEEVFSSSGLTVVARSTPGVRAPGNFRFASSGLHFKVHVFE
jgi:hypothetical protein